MKKAVVPTTAASGAAVSSSRITAVQSVYMGLGPRFAVHLLTPLRQLALGLGAASALTVGPALAGVVFDNCITGPDGAITCDTRPTGNTLADDEAARYGLLDQASPGWAEYNPYEGDDAMLGGGNW